MLKRILAIAVLAASPLQAEAFCGFYVGKADASLFNEASAVIMARDGKRTTLTMQNDYRGELTEFALVVPVPVVLQQGDVKVVEKKIFDRIDAYSSPRLAEYHDADPCAPVPMPAPPMASAARSDAAVIPKGSPALGVRVESSFAVGEYDIVVLAAEQSDGLEAWLTQNGYRIPAGAGRALRPYVRQNMKFFVAKVNLKEQGKTGYQMLRPLQFSFESEKFMLPMRLGMLNANGPQDLIVYAMTKTGRVEASNYRTVKLPANVDLPVYVRDSKVFADFYKSMFAKQALDEGHRAVFTEYVWDMRWCDPCADQPLTVDELRTAGVSWLAEPTVAPTTPPGPPSPPGNVRRPPPANPTPAVTLTRLHLRYTPQTFPEDLMLMVTADRENFQTRYVLRHPWTGRRDACPQAADYFKEVARREQDEAQILSNLTGWPLADIRAKLPKR
ncbi:MAG: DUF2330 domain-containing protein [Alphaproteobacteria bacterium]|nr:DUF2330 domain-containing protein [Alphaproteobacteria bacterium]